MNTTIKRALAAVFVVALGVGAYLARGPILGALGIAGSSFTGSNDSIPTAPVRKGDLEILLKSRGEIKARRSVTLSAPYSVQEVKLVSVTKTGTMVKEGDVIAVIDATQETSKLQEQDSNIKQADKEADKVRAQHRIANEQAGLDLAQANFDVSTAQLETRKQEIVSDIDAAKARLVLETAERHEGELENDKPPRGDSQTAELNQVGRKRKKAERDMNFAQANLKLLTLRSPLAGMLVILGNNRARQGWGPAPEFKPGDQAWPGVALAEIPDLTSLAAVLKIDETDRGRIAVGQTARLKVDAIPDRSFTGKIKEISVTAEMVFEGFPPKKLFKATLETDADPRLRPNMSVSADVAVEKLIGVTLIPTRATFEGNGRTFAWLKTGRGFEAREIVTGQKSEGQVQVISGLKPGDIVALEPPEKVENANQGAVQAPKPGGKQ